MKQILIAATLIISLAACGSGEGQEADLQARVDKAATGDAEAMQDLENQVGEAAKAVPKADGDALEAFNKLVFSGASTPEDIAKLAAGGNPNARVYVAHTEGGSKNISAEDKGLYRTYLEEAATLDGSYQHQTISNLTYSLAGEAAFVISEDYLGGDRLYRQDNEKAVEWLRKAADLGQPEAMYKLGVRYHYGLDMDADSGAAREWLQKSLDAGWKDAAGELTSLE